MYGTVSLSSRLDAYRYDEDHDDDPGISDV
jgi:hypothetical protein